LTQEFSINKLPPGLNGSEGLMQMHWGMYAKIKQDWVWLIRQQMLKKHSGPVKIEFTRRSVQMMDLDNVGASFKVVGDALEEEGIIQDDSPKIVQHLIISWEKCRKRKVQGITVRIEDV
jgi:Holliday junction resolvase RusA-like endonuclease